MMKKPNPSFSSPKRRPATRFAMASLFTLACSATLLAPAHANDLNTVLGGGLGAAAGAAVGQSVGGNNGAVIGGAVGGGAGAAVTTKGSGQTGAIVGGAVGGASGAAVGQSMGGRTGAVVGAGAGGAAGAVIGKSVTQTQSGAQVRNPPSQPVYTQGRTSYRDDGGYDDEHKHKKHKKHKQDRDEDYGDRDRGHPPGHAYGWDKHRD